jgi:hypothetical protein
MTATRQPVEVTLTLPAVSGPGGSVVEHDLAITLPAYWQGLTAAEVVSILRAAYPESDARTDRPFGDTLAAALVGVGAAEPMRAVDFDRVATVSEAVRRVHEWCAAAPADSNPMRRLRRFLDPGATPLGG